jgi:protein SCO1/2
VRRLALLAAWLALSGPASAKDVVAVDAAIRFADRTLMDTDRRPVRFRRDAVGSGPAVISFTFTGCRALCPASDLVMNALEALLAAKKRREVRLVTLTIDPGSDTPDKLAAYATQVDSGPRRLWLTGDLGEMGEVLDGLGMPAGSLDAHEFFFVVVGADGRRSRRVPGERIGAEGLLGEVDRLR